VSSSTSDSRRSAALALALALALSGPASVSPAGAGEAAARGRKAIIVWLDESGERKEADAREIRYGYYERVFLSVPKDGRTFKDEEQEDKGIPIADQYTKFTVIDRIDFERITNPETGAERLSLKLTSPKDRTQMVSGNDLAGSLHPKSPYIAFTSGGMQHRIDMDPRTSEADRRGKPQLVSISFYVKQPPR
jgi:hypothetical protein